MPHMKESFDLERHAAIIHCVLEDFIRDFDDHNRYYPLADLEAAKKALYDLEIACRGEAPGLIDPDPPK